MTLQKATSDDGNGNSWVSSDIAKGLANGSFIFFFGAGFSRSAGYPVGKELAEKLKQYLDSNARQKVGSKEQSLDNVLQELLVRHDRKTVCSLINRIFDDAPFALAQTVPGQSHSHVIKTHALLYELIGRLREIIQPNPHIPEQSCLGFWHGVLVFPSLPGRGRFVSFFLLQSVASYT